MRQRVICCCVEPQYRASLWAEQTLEGLRREAIRKKMHVLEISPEAADWISCESLRQEGMCVVIGTSVNWTPETVGRLLASGIQPLLVSFDAGEPGGVRGQVLMDHAGATKKLLRYLEACGKNRTAYFAFNPESYADMVKLNTARLLGKGEAKDVFPNSGDLLACCGALLERYCEYDSVLCANDIAAVSLLRQLCRHDIRVPEDLYLASYGNLALGSRSGPGITCVTLDHTEMGRQAAALYACLGHMPPDSTLTVRVPTRLVIRGSTAGFRPSALPEEETARSECVDFYRDPEAGELLAMEAMLCGCDETDMKMLSLMAKGTGSEEMQKQLFLSASAIQYRKKQLMKTAGCSSRTWQEFLRRCTELGITA